MHKERILPWSARGRWFEVFVESNGTAISITTSDIEGAEISSNVIKLPKGLHALQWVVDSDNDTSSAGDFILKKKLYADGCTGVYVPAVSQFTYAKVYIFGYNE